FSRDWSSDVCSSDLMAEDLPQLSHQVKRVDLIDRLREVLHALPDPLRPVAVDDHHGILVDIIQRVTRTGSPAPRNPGPVYGSDACSPGRTRHWPDGAAPSPHAPSTASLPPAVDGLPAAAAHLGHPPPRTALAPCATPLSPPTAWLALPSAPCRPSTPLAGCSRG